MRSAYRVRITKWLLIYWAAFVLGPYLVPFAYYVDASATWYTRALLTVFTTFVMMTSILIGRWLTERLGCEELQLTRGLGLWLLGLLAGALVAWMLGAGMYLTGPLMAGFFGYLGGMAMRRDR